VHEVITPSEVAALLQIHVKTVYRLARQGVLPGRQIGRRWRFSRSEILGLVSHHGPNGDAARPAEPPLEAQ
jgi:excisionase family DNA binding protein